MKNQSPLSSEVENILKRKIRAELLNALRLEDEPAKINMAPNNDEAAGSDDVNPENLLAEKVIKYFLEVDITKTNMPEPNKYASLDYSNKRKRFLKHFKNSISELFHQVWMDIRTNNEIDIPRVRYLLFRLALHTIGQSEAMHLNLSLPRKRQLDVDLELVSKTPFDLAYETVWHIRFKMKPKDEKEAVICLLVELLWLGLPLKSCLELTSAHFDPINNMILIPYERAYIPFPADLEFWGRYNGLRPYFPDWFWSFRNSMIAQLKKGKQRKVKLLGDYFFKSYQDINGFLTQIIKILECNRKIEKCSIPDDYIIKKLSWKQLYECGKYHKIVCRGLTPSMYAVVSSKRFRPTVKLVPGIEIGKYFILNQRIVKNTTLKEYAELNVDSKESYDHIHQCLEILRPEIKDQKYDKRSKLLQLEAELLVRFFDNHRETIEYLHGQEALKKELLKGLPKHLSGNSKVLKEAELFIKNADSYKLFLKKIYANTATLHIVSWINNLLKSNKPNTVTRYIDSLFPIVIFTEAQGMNILELTEDDLLSIVSEQELIYGKNLKESWINHKTFKSIKTALNSFYDYMDKQEYSIRRINFNYFRNIAKKSPKLVYIAEEERIKKAIINFWRRKKTKAAAMAMILGCYLGLRKREILGLRIADVRIFGDINNEYNYISIIGKFSKRRFVAIKYIDKELRPYFYSYWKESLKEKSEHILRMDKVYQIEDLFSRHLKEFFPDGFHGMRRAFATWNAQKGKSSVKLANAMGHLTINTFMNYNHEFAKDTCDYGNPLHTVMPKKLDYAEAAHFASCSERNIWNHIKDMVKPDLKPNPNKNRRLKQKTMRINTKSFLDWQFSCLKSDYLKFFKPDKRAEIVIPKLLIRKSERLSRKKGNKKA
ncbi:MAG: site-specific integrase [Elusimicrobiota bacterium]